MNKFLLFSMIFSLFSISNIHAVDCTAQNANKFNGCANDNNTTSITLINNINNAGDAVDLSGLTINLVTYNLTFINNQTITINNGTSFTISTGTNTLNANGQIVDRDGAGTNVTFSELNSALQSGLYTTLADALASILPIELSHFSGKSSTNNNILQWTTVSETNNHYFEIEHSKNAKEFKVIAEIAGAGTTDLTNDYKFVHENINGRINYYRLKQVDYDGAFSYSAVILVKTAVDNAILIYPNIVKDELRYELNEFSPSADLQFRIISQQGKVFYQQKLAREQGLGNIPVSFLPKGSYFLQVLHQSEISYAKFIKL